MGRKNNNDLRGGGNHQNKAEDRATKTMLKKAKEKVLHTKKVMFSVFKVRPLCRVKANSCVYVQLQQRDLWRKDLQRFKEQLSVVGFDLKEIPGDGNCLFRALGDQIEGTQDKVLYLLG